MATITKRGDLQWQVKVRRRGFPSQSRTFDTKAQAEAWERMVEGEMDRGVFVDRSEYEKTTFLEALDRYEREVAVLKKGYPQEKYKIAYWKRTPFTSRYLAGLRSTDLAAWQDNYLKTHSPFDSQPTPDSGFPFFHDRDQGMGDGGPCQSALPDPQAEISQRP